MKYIKYAMKYRAVANSSLSDGGYKWLVVDEKDNIISRHAEKEAAEKKAKRLTNSTKYYDIPCCKAEVYLSLSDLKIFRESPNTEQ
jgi:hypothetical protein